MNLTRRRFLEIGGVLAAYGLASPVWVRLGDVEAAAAAPIGPKLVVLYLAGGNDGLNTVIPYGTGAYYSKRPTIAIPQTQVLKLPDSATLGLHPNLKTVQAMYGDGSPTSPKDVAIVLGVGYDNPDLSHFGSTDVWMTGSPTHAASTGWLGRWLDLTPDGTAALRAVSIGYSLPQLLIGAEKAGSAIPGYRGFAFYDGLDNDPRSEAYRLHNAFLRCATPGTPPSDPQVAAVDTVDQRTVNAVRAVQSLGSLSAPDPRTLADQMSLAISLLNSSLGIDIAFLQLGSFDDHLGENPNHDKLLQQVDDAVARFRDDIARTGNPGSYLMLTFSEFGRRVNEDGSNGTDHGTAAPHFVIGPAVKGGLYGRQPGLDNGALDANGNMLRQVELREVYATIIDGWLQRAASTDVLGYTSTSGINPVAFL